MRKPRIKHSEEYVKEADALLNAARKSAKETVRLLHEFSKVIGRMKRSSEKRHGHGK
ncbi:MAG: hypothetical protein M0024_01490 [Nitrospiraceae bacterium]|nr:hypothetical protein [Nitrospiraceae bacterium]